MSYTSASAPVLCIDVECFSLRVMLVLRHTVDWTSASQSRKGLQTPFAEAAFDYILFSSDSSALLALPYIFILFALHTT